MDTKNGLGSDHSVDPPPPLQIEMDVDIANHRDGADLMKLTKPIVDTEKIRPTREELLEIVQQLKQTQARQDKKIKKLKRFSNTVKYVFRKEWKKKMGMWKVKSLALREIRKEKAKLERTLEELKKSVREIGGKEEEIQRLKERIANLQEVPHLSASNVTEGHQKEVCKLGAGRKDAVAIFPEEIWKMILGNLSDPIDLWNCYNTCSLFEDLLHDWKTSWEFEQTLPYFYQYLPGPALLKCRKICSGWLNAVDNLLGDHPSLRPYSDSPGPDPRGLEFVNPLKQTGVGWRNVFTSSDYESLLLDEGPDIEDYPCKNVFVGRNVIINIGGENGYDDGGSQQLWDRVNKFLTAFGNDIWYLTISFPNDGGWQFEADMAKQKVIEFLTVDVFHLVPNLRKLTIEQVPDTSGVAIQPNYPPTLKLETIDVMFDEDEPEPLITSLLTHYHAQLRRLHVNLKNWKDVFSLGWPNLSELHIAEVRQLENFEGLLEGMPQLRKLGLKASGGVSISQYASFLANLQKVISTTRLTTLRLQLNFGIEDGHLDDEDFDKFIGELEAKTDSNLFMSPTLKTIEIDHDKMGKWARSYNFLLRYFPLIENLHVFRRRTEDEHREKFRSEMDLLARSEETLYFKWFRSFYYKSEEDLVGIIKYAYGGEMYKSNIWELFPRLKVFTFMWDKYTRGCYEAYLEALSKSKGLKMPPKLK